MKEFIDKLISELKEEHEGFINRYGIVGGNVPASIVKRCMNIVNELAEEYKVSEMPTGWIPLTKQLPEYGQYVLACVPPKDGINGGHPVVIMEFREDNEPLFYRFVSAWQPLPAPYTEGE